MALFVLSGVKGTGKTTVIKNWVTGRSDAGGFLSPIKDGLRQFYFLSTRNYLCMECANPEEEDCWLVGKFAFSKDSFEKAVGVLSNDCKNGKRITIFDEYGPLEQQNQGLMPAVDQILRHASQASDQDMLVIIRTNLLDYFISKYPVQNSYTIHTISNFFSRYPDHPAN